MFGINLSYRCNHLGDTPFLNQNDFIAQREFNDRIAFGGWSIDLHPPQGVYSTESGSKHMQPDGINHIPFRSLYSANVSNLLFAGRNISASHAAFGTTRVMATCALRHLNTSWCIKHWCNLLFCKYRSL